MNLICIGGSNTAPGGPKVTFSPINLSLPARFAANVEFILATESIEIEVTGEPETEALVPLGIIRVVFPPGDAISSVVLTMNVEMFMKFPIVLLIIVLLTVTILVSDALNTPFESFAYTRNCNFQKVVLSYSCRSAFRLPP